MIIDAMFKKDQFILKKKMLVISAVNQIDGGTLQIVEDFLEFANSNCENLEVVALINKKVLRKFKKKFKNIKLFTFSLPKKSWFFRLIFEYVYCSLEIVMLSNC